MKNSFYSRDELINLNFKSLGDDVLISRNTSIYNPEVISIGNKVRIDDFCIISGGDGIELGNFIHLSAYAALFGGAGIIIKDFSGLSARVTVYSESDDYSGHSLTNPMIPLKYKPKYSKGTVVMEKHCIVGVNSTILPGVRLGEGVSVGAHSLVSKNCEEWSMYFGIPAKRLKKRSDKLLTLEKQFMEEWNNFQ